MTCSRCQGFMVEDHVLDFEDPFRLIWATGWRCVNCGRIHDSVVEQNRLAPEEKASVFPSGEPDYQDDEVHLGAEAFIKNVA